jgi:hypothetical protein
MAQIAGEWMIFGAACGLAPNWQASEHVPGANVEAGGGGRSRRPVDARWS